MTEYMKSLVNKQCEIETQESAYSGIVLEISDGWLVIQDTDEDAVKCLNMNYVVCIEEASQEEDSDNKNPWRELFGRRGG